jgi:hypothetical protein
MSGTIRTPHLNPLPDIGERRKTRALAGLNSSPPCLFLRLWLFLENEASEILVTCGTRASIFPWARSGRLSLSRRERIEVRDCFCPCSPKRTRLIAGHFRVQREPGDSKISAPQFLGARVIRHGHGRVFDRFGNCVRRRLARSRASLTGNRSRECMDRADAVAGICIRRNFDFVNVAKEFAQRQFPFYAANGRASRQNNIIWLGVSREANVRFVPSFSAPHLNPLPATGERRTGGSIV